MDVRQWSDKSSEARLVRRGERMGCEKIYPRFDLVAPQRSHSNGCESYVFSTTPINIC